MDTTTEATTTPTAHLPAPHPVLPREPWLARRQALLAREMELTRLGCYEDPAAAASPGASRAPCCQHQAGTASS